jgi:hypothetical protein
MKNEEREKKAAAIGQKLREIYEGDLVLFRRERDILNRFVKFAIVLSIVLVIIAIALAFESTAEAARPNVTPFDPNVVAFPYDPNQVQGKLIGAQTVRTGTTWTRDFWLWFSRDAALEFQVAPGSATRTNVVIDDTVTPPDKTQTHRVSYAVGSGERVVYVIVTGSADGALGPPHTFLLNVERPPDEMILWTGEIIPWWIPHAAAWLGDESIDEGHRLRTWQRGRKFAGGKILTEKELNDSGYVAWKFGQVVIP